MADKDLSKLLETQVSLSEWIQRIDHEEAAALSEEDNYKRERIGQVSDIIGLPYDKPTQFEAQDLVDKTPAFRKFLEERGDELCALRLIPKKGTQGLPKLRNRGLSIREVMGWFEQQNIDPSQYVADFVPHPPDNGWATIFIVNDKGIFGEIYYGGHHVLTQGMHGDAAPLVFGYDFTNWWIEPDNEDALTHLKELVAMIKVDDPAKRQALEKEVDATFANDYIKGYFETSQSSQGIWYIDYNRILAERYSDFLVQRTDTSTAAIKGRQASPGQAQGTVFLASTPVPVDTFPEGAILVCQMTSPDYLPLMQKAAAIVTDQGGILCHAAIVARELGKPCIVGTGNATSQLKTGDLVQVDATAGTVTKK